MKTALTDFTYKELQLLSLAVADQIKTCTNNLLTLSKFDESEFKTEQCAYWNGLLETYMLWDTQILDAAMSVKRREVISSN